MVKECLRALNVPGLGFRCDQIEKPYGTTFGWIWENNSPNTTQFVDWLKDKCGIYWIRGKPGSGKSTMMKYSFTHPSTQEGLPSDLGSWIIAGFFFHDRGTATQKSLEGLLRSILFQILNAENRFIHEVWPALSHRASGRVESNTEQELKSALLAVAQSKKVSANICLFIDALDEHDGSDKDHADMVEFFGQLSSPSKGTVNTKICVASRDYNVFRDLLGHWRGLCIEQWTRPDIIKYVTGKLSGHPRVTGSKSDREASARVAQNIVNGAHGVFLWVRLVVEQLEEGLTEGDSFAELEAVLSSLPKDIKLLYARILERIKPQYRFEAYVMLQVVRCATNPLKVEDFWFVIRQALRIQGPMTLSSLQRRIKSRCRGLIEVHINKSDWSPISAAHSDEPYPESELEPESLKSLRCAILGSPDYWRDRYGIQFLHQTAKEFAQTPSHLRGLVSRDTDLQDNGSSWLLQAGVDMMLSACPQYPHRRPFRPHNARCDQWTIQNVMTILKYAQLAEASLAKPFSKPLVELNVALEKHVDTSWKQNLTPAVVLGWGCFVTAFDFRSWEPKRSILSLCITAGLKQSVADMVTKIAPSICAEEVQILLYYALRPTISEFGLQSREFGDTLFFLDLLTSSDACASNGHRYPSALSYLTERMRCSGQEARLWELDNSTDGVRIIDPSVESFVIRLLEILLSHGAGPNEQINHLFISEATTEKPWNLDDKSAYTYSKRSKNKRRAKRGWYRPIHAIVRMDNVAILQCLLALGAELHTEDSAGRTALHIAWRYQCHVAWNWLISKGARITRKMLEDACDYNNDYEEGTLDEWFVESAKRGHFGNLAVWEPEALEFAKEHVPEYFGKRRLQARHSIR